jgi:isopenicillin-N N-acyltransferase like protein
MKRFTKIIFRILIVLVVMLALLVGWFAYAVRLNNPEVLNEFDPNEQKELVAANTYTFQDSWLKKNEHGLWEMYITGDPFEMGYKKGVLADSLIELQEIYFVNNIQKLVPSKSYLNVLKYFVALYNRNLDAYVPEEYLKEIYGVSMFASDEYNFIGTPYRRILNYHAAHDLGHALQNMNLVACTAFMVKDDKSADSTMIIGRNMDFSSGDDFAENKIIAFYKPNQGYNFCFITWGGMIGVVSGMNDQGLVVTLNAANSDIPTSAKTPVSILARHVLQYASNIEEAYAIIEKTDVFVAELFLIGSAKDRLTVVVEKAINKTALYQTNTDQLILTNHFQSDSLKDTELNKKSILDDLSPYRWKRTEELLAKTDKHTVATFANILRDQKGLNGADIGMGNEKAINQLIAHHSVIFKPEKLQIWISTNPYQLGAFLCYDLAAIFNNVTDFNNDAFLSDFTIPEDDFLHSNDFSNFRSYKEMTAKIKAQIKNGQAKEISAADIQLYENLNPEFFYTYVVIAEYYNSINETDKALMYYQKALSKEIARQTERVSIENQIASLSE